MVHWYGRLDFWRKQGYNSRTPFHSESMHLKYVRKAHNIVCYCKWTRELSNARKQTRNKRRQNEWCSWRKAVQVFKVGHGQMSVLFIMLYNHHNSLLIFLSPCFLAWSCLLRISFLTLPLLLLIPSLPPSPPPLHHSLHPQLFKYYFSPLLSSSPPFFSPSLYLVIACQ